MILNRKLIPTICLSFILVGCGGQGGQNSSSAGSTSVNAPTQTAYASPAPVPTFGPAPPPIAPAPVSAGSCPSANALGPQYDAIVPSNSIDATLFDAAVLHYTNVRRCANGIAPLVGDRALLQAAAAHSNDMANLNFFSHTSPVPGRAKLPDRLKGEGINFLDASENIAQRSRLQLISGRSFTVKDRATCDFAYDGQMIQPHSYRSMAADFVQAWEASPGHRQNLFNPIYKRLGTGGSFKPNSRNCGDIVATQNFTS